jgi:hypothetical protein
MLSDVVDERFSVLEENWESFVKIRVHLLNLVEPLLDNIVQCLVRRRRSQGESVTTIVDAVLCPRESGCLRRVELRLDRGARGLLVLYEEILELGRDDKRKGQDIEIWPPEPPEDSESFPEQEPDLSPEAGDLSRGHLEPGFGHCGAALGEFKLWLVCHAKEDIFNLRTRNRDIRDSPRVQEGAELSSRTRIRGCVDDVVLMHCRGILKVESKGRSRRENPISTAMKILQLCGSSLTSHFALGQDDNVVSKDIHLVEEMCCKDDAPLRPLLKKNLPDDSA